MENIYISSFADLSKCPICTKSIIKANLSEKVDCFYCNKTYNSYFACKEKHFFCDTCLGLPLKELIKNFCINSVCTDPMKLAADLMKHPYFPEEGSEHTFLVTAVLLTAYSNAMHDEARKINLLNEADMRTFDLYLQSSDYYGCSGTAIASAIFIKILNEYYNLFGEDWKHANYISSQILQNIADYSPKRCFKREVFFALNETSSYLANNLNNFILLNHHDNCEFESVIQNCSKDACPFYTS